MFCQPALAFNPATQSCDLAFDGTDLTLDATAATPLLISIGCDRRAHTDDVLPDVVTNTYAPSRLNARRGWAGDALDRQARLTGSRLWLFQRAKQNEATRRGVESALSEAVDWFNTQLGLSVSLTVRWVRSGVLGYMVQLGAFTATLTMPVGA